MPRHGVPSLQALRRPWSRTSGSSPQTMMPRPRLALGASVLASADQNSGIASHSLGCIDIRPRYMYSAGLLSHCSIRCPRSTIAYDFSERLGDSLLFGSQACAWKLLCLDHHEWLQVVLCNKTCHDYVRERASASALILPSDMAPLPSG